MSDLEWLATHLGWTELLWHGDELYGQPTKDILGWNHKCQFHRELNRYLFPRYDQSIDLMVELVNGLEDREQYTYVAMLLAEMSDYAHPAEFFKYDRPHMWADVFKLHNAPASLRLKAYRQVMEKAHGTTQAPTQDGD